MTEMATCYFRNDHPLRFQPYSIVAQITKTGISLLFSQLLPDRSMYLREQIDYLWSDIHDVINHGNYILLIGFSKYKINGTPMEITCKNGKCSRILLQLSSKGQDTLTKRFLNYQIYRKEKSC